MTDMVGQVVVAIVVADLFAAVGHWAEDNYLPYDVSLPLLGDIAKENELHHFAPKSITEGSYFETCKVMIVLTIVFVAFCRCVLEQFCRCPSHGKVRNKH